MYVEQKNRIDKNYEFNEKIHFITATKTDATKATAKNFILNHLNPERIMMIVRMFAPFLFEPIRVFLILLSRALVG